MLICGVELFMLCYNLVYRIPTHFPPQMSTNSKCITTQNPGMGKKGVRMGSENWRMISVSLSPVSLTPKAGEGGHSHSQLSALGWKEREMGDMPIKTPPPPKWVKWGQVSESWCFPVTSRPEWKLELSSCWDGNFINLQKASDPFSFHFGSVFFFAEGLYLSKQKGIASVLSQTKQK